MSDISFKIDTSCDNINRSSRLFYLTNGDIEDVIQDGCTKPSQERPQILKQKAKRYHEKGTEKKFKPGKISYALRKALGLGMCDIPIHIYRMRHLGYPPGWLKKAEVKKESLSITGANAVVCKKFTDNSVKYDWQLLHEYPGFNSCRNYEYRHDRGRQLGYIDMQNDCLLENFLGYLAERRLLGREETDMPNIRSQVTTEGATEFNLPVGACPPSTVAKKPDICRPPADTAPEEGTVLLVPTATKPPLDRFSLGINDHRLFENLPNAGGSYQKVLAVLRRPRPIGQAESR